jgi:hypothetical protein
MIFPSMGRKVRIHTWIDIDLIENVRPGLHISLSSSNYLADILAIVTGQTAVEEVRLQMIIHTGTRYGNIGMPNSGKFPVNLDCLYAFRSAFPSLHTLRIVLYHKQCLTSIADPVWDAIVLSTKEEIQKVSRAVIREEIRTVEATYEDGSRTTLETRRN